MIGTATLKKASIPVGFFAFMCVMMGIVLLAIFITFELQAELSRLYGKATVATTALTIIFSIPLIVALLATKYTDEKILVFDNNTGHIQAIDGGESLGRVLERTPARIVSVPCVFVADKEKQRHDCTFVNLGGGSFEVWDTATFRQAHPPLLAAVFVVFPQL
ncbi:hypothetical protein [Mobiluncus curtisii]|uniref:hypothetical protein n=1 Tax=Mobiluncus curtisii TaxID=2051 RepID=UPI00146FE420|nr:hypothetical protein [Mobiluncus curtisii]NMW48986.1 hypothetical protein [Mobiluncus curtisii]NMW89101.1 hypothetical protein [Mobiluncus curtisii]